MMVIKIRVGSNPDRVVFFLLSWTRILPRSYFRHSITIFNTLQYFQSLSQVKQNLVQKSLSIQSIVRGVLESDKCLH